MISQKLKTKSDAVIVPKKRPARSVIQASTRRCLVALDGSTTQKLKPPQINRKHDSKGVLYHGKKMREAQKDFSSTHATVYLKTSRALEKSINEEIKRVEKLERARASPWLF